MKNNTNLLPGVLLWGGKSAARIASEMLLESETGTPAIIFDSTQAELHFDSPAYFTNKVDDLAQNLYRVTHYISCIGAEHGYARFMTGKYLESIGLKPLSLIHYKSFIDHTSSIGTGCQVMPCATVHKFTTIGRQAIINTGATIDHECTIGDGVHIMGNAAIAGKVDIGNFATIGTNATILPTIKIGTGAIVGAGAVITKDVKPYTITAGVPAKEIRKHEPLFHEETLIKLINKLRTL